MDVKLALVEEASRIVSGARRNAYGPPEKNFERIAAFWKVYIWERFGQEPIELEPRDVAALMRLMKEARLLETPDHWDSHVDLVGYALCGAECAGVKPPAPSDAQGTARSTAAPGARDGSTPPTMPHVFPEGELSGGETYVLATGLSPGARSCSPRFG